jgi:hypothetical protein
MRSRVGGSLGGPALCHVLCRRVKRDYSKNTETGVGGIPSLVGMDAGRASVDGGN